MQIYREKNVKINYKIFSDNLRHFRLYSMLCLIYNTIFLKEQENIPYMSECKDNCLYYRYVNNTWTYNCSNNRYKKYC